MKRNCVINANIAKACPPPSNTKFNGFSSLCNKNARLDTKSLLLLTPASLCPKQKKMEYDSKMTLSCPIYTNYIGLYGSKPDITLDPENTRQF